MIKVSLCVDDICNDCPMFKPNYHHLKQCAEGKGAIVNLIEVKCANSDLCAYIRTFVKNNEEETNEIPEQLKKFGF